MKLEQSKGKEMARGPNGNGAHVLVIPFPGFGHILPHLDLANQLALRGLKITVLVTPKNLPYLNPLLSLHRDSVQTLVLPFPPQPSLPPGVESLHEVPAVVSFPFIASAMSQLYDSVFQWIQNHPSPPVAIIPDIYFSSWTRRLATDFGIKVVGYSAINANSLLSFWARPDMPEFFRQENIHARESSWGLIFNSFVEFERERLDEIKTEFLGHDRVWAVGPLLPMESLERGGPSSVPVGEVLAWLDSCGQDPQADKSSVVFVGFGTQITLSKRQMEAVARALEDSGVRFIWAVKDPLRSVSGQAGSEEDHHQSVLPTGFEDRVAGRGLIIRGWAPQVRILNHPAVGCYLTHCGWNSVLEGLLGGVLLLAWPMQIDHYYNANLLVDKFGAAIRVCEGNETIPDPEKLARILRESANSDRSERIQAIELRRKALEAITKGGTSHDALDGLVEEISKLKFNAHR